MSLKDKIVTAWDVPIDTEEMFYVEDVKDAYIEFKNFLIDNETWKKYIDKKVFKTCSCCTEDEYTHKATGIRFNHLDSEDLQYLVMKDIFGDFENE